MSLNVPDVGTGLKMVWGTSLFTAYIRAANGKSIERPKVDITHMESLAREFMPGDLVNHGEVDLDIFFDPDQQPPIGAVRETVTIKWPKLAAWTTEPKVAGSAFVRNWEWTAPLEEAMTAKFTLVWATAPTYTAHT